jgi:outer membrane murein-binding lipoprotein Lpp
MCSFGDPNAPKFVKGLKEDTPWNWDLNWKNQVQAEKKQSDGRAAVLQAYLEKKAEEEEVAGRKMKTNLRVPPPAQPRARLGLTGTIVYEVPPETGASLAAAGASVVSPSRRSRLSRADKVDKLRTMVDHERGKRKDLEAEIAAVRAELRAARRAAKGAH